MNSELPTWVKVQAVPTHPLHNLLAAAFDGRTANIAEWARNCGMSPEEMIETIADMVIEGQVTAEFFIEEVSK